jgi:hypothetical protein
MDRWDEEGDDGRPHAEPTGLPLDEWYDDDVLAAIDAGPLRSEPPPPPPPVSRLSAWSRRSAIGAVLTGMALGLQEVFDPEEERTIVIEVEDDESLPDLPVQMILDPDSPHGSLCIVHRDRVPPPVV